MVSLFIFSAPLLVIRGSPPSIRRGQRKRRERSNSSSTRQTVSVLPIRPSPLKRGQPPSPSGSFSLRGAKSHKTAMLLYTLADVRSGALGRRRLRLSHGAGRKTARRPRVGC